MYVNPFEEIVELVGNHLDAGSIALALDQGKYQYSSAEGFTNNDERKIKADARVSSIPFLQFIERREKLDSRDIILALRDLLAGEGGTNKYSLKFQVCRALVLQVLQNDQNLQAQLSPTSKKRYEKIKVSQLEEVYLLDFRMMPGQCLELIDAFKHKLGELGVVPGEGMSSRSPLLGRKE
ncbi:MAG TPA: hypothetical protein VGV92_07340 [Gammaproteobacteria bacterium]|nr:hypothetical protein [Gammaproteobacteria bacterium]